MKTLILCLLLVAFISSGHSQILLKESRVDYVPYSMKVDPVTNSVTLNIPEAKIGEFEKDPLAFIQERFDIQRFIEENRDHDYDYYEADFKTNKGVVQAKYDKKGEMISTHQNFKNVALPDDVKFQILQNFRNSRVLKNNYIVTSKKWIVDRDYYKVKIHDGEKVRRLRIDRSTEGLSLVSF